MKGTDAKLVCVLISEADRVLYFTTALPAPDISSEPTPSRAPRQRTGVQMWVSLSLFSLSSLSSSTCGFPSFSKDKSGLYACAVAFGCRRRRRHLSDSLHFKASLQQLWVKIGGFFCSVGGWEGSRGEILPALQQICQANEGRRRRSSGMLPLSQWLRRSCQTQPWASCFSCTHVLPGKASRKTPDM